MVAPNSLVAGKHYVFELTVTDDNTGASGVAYVYIKVSAAPIIIDFRVDALQNTGAFAESSEWLALFTEFITVLEYSPAKDSDKFRFDFMFTDEFEAGFAMWRAIGEVFLPTVSGFLLPSGNLTLRGCVTDVYLSRACAQRNITVNQVNITQIGGVCNLGAELTARVEASNEGESQLIATTMQEFTIISGGSNASTNDSACMDDMIGSFVSAIELISNDSSSAEVALSSDDFEALIQAAMSLITIMDQTGIIDDSGRWSFWV